MNSKPLVFTWSKLPWAAQLKCVEYMDNETRYSLKLCSRFNKNLVEYYLLHVENATSPLSGPKPPLFIFWNQLPWDVLLKCVQNMDRYSRKSLKMCSSDHCNLVKYANSIFPLPPPRKLESCEIHVECGQIRKTNFELKVWLGDNEYADTIVTNEVDSFVHSKISEFDIFEKIIIKINDGRGFKLSPRPFLLSCRKLDLTSFVFPTTINILKQFDPYYLEKLTLVCFEDDEPQDLWNMEHVTRVKKLKIYGGFINDDQLVQLEAAKLKIDWNETITSDGINKYIKKRLLSLDKCDCKFEIEFKPDPFTIENLCRDLDVACRAEDSRKTVFIVNSPFPEFQLEFTECFDMVEGRRIVKKDRNGHLKRWSSEILKP